MNCPVCHDAREPGWLCEEHGLPWEHDRCQAAGVPCICNPEGAIELDEWFAEVPSSKPPN
jgi:hypothetical protein